MPCDEIRQSLLQLGWDADERRKAAEALAHLETCAECRKAIEDYEHLAQMLKVEESAEPAGGWDAFQRRLAVAPVRRRNWLAGLSAVAASLLMGAIGVMVGRAIWSSAPPKPDRQAAQLQFTPGEVVQQVRAFDEVSQVLDRKASWMLVANGSSDVGLAPRPLADGKLVLLRLRMSRGKNVISSADLVIVPGQKANLTLPLSAGTSLMYRVGTFADEPGRLSLWAELQTPQGNEPIAAVATTLQLKPDEPVTAGKLVTTAGPYELDVAFSPGALPRGQ